MTSRFDTALAAAQRPLMLDTPAAASRAVKAWRRAGCLGLDTEFVRERTYHANLGLVQISDGQTVWLLDPLVEETLAPLTELLQDEGVIKLLHSPSEDLEVLLHVTGVAPEPLVDTQLACAMLGQPLQLGYHKAVEWLLNVPVEKELTRSNWCARPLRSELLHYAALDVCLLPEMWGRLRARLEELGRLDWLAEDCRRQLADARRPVAPADAWQRIRGSGKLDGSALAILASLAAWREREAQKRNRPRGFIVNDMVLLRIAAGKPRHANDLEAVEDLHPRARKRYGKGIVNMVGQVLESGKTQTPPPRLGGAQRKRLKRLRAGVAREAEHLGLEPALLASRKELEELVVTGAGAGLPGRLAGWRATVLEPVLNGASTGD